MPIYSEDIEALGLYRHGAIIQQTDGSLVTTLPERVEFQERSDTLIHVVAEGERLTDLAVLYYKEVFGDAAVDMWEVIAQFQPTPIIDGTIALPVDAEILIPSEDFIRDEAFGSSLSEVPEV